MSIQPASSVGLNQKIPEITTRNRDLGMQVSDRDKGEIKKLANEFEAIFLQIMLKSMRDAVPKSELVDGGNGEDIFRTMLDSEYAKSMAEQRTSGIAQNIENQLLGLTTYNKVANGIPGNIK